MRRRNTRNDRRSNPQQQPQPAAAEAPAPAAGTGLPLIVVSDTFWVQTAELVPCGVAGCGSWPGPEAYEPVSLDEGEAMPRPLCDEHILAYLRR